MVFIHLAQSMHGSGVFWEIAVLLARHKVILHAVSRYEYGTYSLNFHV
jgi:hypothetical protein